jgi:tRNA threonylcarbamoyladenosine biosynthesis protein TsaE
MKYSFVSTCPRDTLEFGMRLGQLLEPGDVVCLEGELGAGKTVLTQGIAKGMDIDCYVTSPTYTLINEYSGTIPLYHFDLYRLEDEEELYHIGGEDLIYGQGVSVIEWASRAKNLMPRDCIRIGLARLAESESARFIELTAGEIYRTLVERVRRNENTGD